jgi:hypothetical protein
MRKEYDLRSLTVKRRGFAATAAFTQKPTQDIVEKQQRDGKSRAKKRR